MYRNNDLYTLPLRNKDLNIEINETAKELRALVKKSAGLEKQYYEMLYKQLSNIKRAYKVCSKYGISVIDAILTANTIYATHQWDNTGLINNYMVIFLELDFKDKCFLSEYGFFDLDNKVFTSKYYYVVDVVLASIVKDSELIGLDVFKLNAILEDKLKEIRDNIKHPATPIGWVGYTCIANYKGVVSNE